MMKKILWVTCAIVAILMNHATFADPSGLFFNVTSGGSSLSITTTIPNHTYPYAGIKINTKGYSLTHVGTQCSDAGNGFCLFSVSDTMPVTMGVTGSAGQFSATLCLNGKGPFSCQRFDDLMLGMPRFAYIGNFSESPSVVLCSLNANTGAIQACQDSGGGVPPSFGSNGIVFNNSGRNVFITGDGDTHLVYQCSVNPMNGMFYACSSTDITLAGYAPEYGMIALNPANTLAYIGDNSGRIIVCPIVNNVIQNSCANTGATGVNTSVSGLTLNKAGTTAYVANYSPARITVCSVNGTSFSSCIAKTGGSPITFTEPGDVALNNAETIVYITDYDVGKVYGCSTTPNNTSTFSSCFVAVSGIPNAWGIALNASNTVAYVSDFSSNLYTCPILNTGVFGTCKVSASVLEGTGIALGY